MSFKDLLPWRPKEPEHTRSEMVPASTYDRLRWEMDSLFDRVLRNYWDEFQAPAAGIWKGFGAFSPTLDVSDTADEVIVRAEVPGVTPEEINIDVADGVLTLSGEKKETTERKENGYAQSECRFGSFRRAISIPHSVDPENVDAEYKQGVLTIRMKKVESEKAKRITVKVAEK